MRITVGEIKEMKQKGERISMLTAYDYSMARLLDEAGAHMLLVGDSLGMVILGYDSMVAVTMEDMLHHTRAVVRGTQRAFIVGDMPFMSYHISSDQALANAARFLQEAGAQAVKLEGGRNVAATVRRMVDCGIPVMGHIGLTPQYSNVLGGFKVQGRSREAAQAVLADALALEEAGVFSMVLECIPAPLARLITERVGVPTIGIGAGVHCDGQVQVIHDLLGLLPHFTPKHAKQFATLHVPIKEAVTRYIAEVRSGQFPTAKESFSMDESLLAGI